MRHPCPEEVSTYGSQRLRETHGFSSDASSKILVYLHRPENFTEKLELSMCESRLFKVTNVLLC